MLGLFARELPDRRTGLECRCNESLESPASSWIAGGVSVEAQGVAMRVVVSIGGRACLCARMGTSGSDHMLRWVRREENGQRRRGKERERRDGTNMERDYNKERR